MNPVYDIVCVLLETPFSRWKDEDKADVLNCGRPTEPLQLYGTKEVKHSGKCYNLSFKRSWFKEFPWLCSSPTLQKLFCWPCLLFSNKSNVWNREGFAALLNITRSLHKHADSAEHLKCQLNLKTLERNRNIISDALKENARLYTVQFNENVRLNRLVLQLVIDAVLYLSKQEIAFRSHDETRDSINRGNFKELLTLLVSRSPVEIQNQYSKIKSVFSGKSKSIQSEVIECISDFINDFVKTELETASFFSVQVDDMTDITQVSQCSVIVRFVNVDGAVVERFLGFYDVSADRSSETLFALFDKLLGPFGYEHKLVGQSYDGASVMSGHLNGLQKKIQEKAPLAVFVHCLAQRLNLILQQSCKKIRKCRMFFSSITGISTFFHHSLKRTYAIVSASGPRIPNETPVCWSSNSKLLGVIVDDWEKLKEVFEAIVCCEESDDNSTQLARGFLHEMNSFEFTFLAVVFHDTFRLTDILFDVLQKRSLDVNYCISKIRSTCDVLRNKRNEQYFSVIFEKASKITEMRFTREYSSLPEDECVQIYRALYYDILDHILMEMDERFRDYEKIQFVCLADTTKFEEYHTCFPSPALENVHNFFGSVFPKTNRLRNELSILYADEKYRQISTQNMLEMLHEDKDIFTDAYKLFSLTLSISSTATCVGRSFSCLKRIKTYLRNAISEERLSSLGNIAIQKELLLQLMKKQPFYEDITDKFAALKDRKIDLVYKKWSSSSSGAGSSTKRTPTEDSVEETVKRLKTEEVEIADEEERHEDDDEPQHDDTSPPVDQVVTKIEVSSGLFEDGTALEQDVAQEMAREQEAETSTSPPTAAVYLPEESQPSAFSESEEPLPSATNQETLDSKSSKINKGPVCRSEDDVLNKVLEIVSTSSDDNQILGDFVASSLRSLHSDHIRRRLKRKIQVAILEESELDERNYMAGLGTSPIPTPVQILTFAHVNESQNAQNIV